MIIITMLITEEIILEEESKTIVKDICPNGGLHFSGKIIIGF